MLIILLLANVAICAVFDTINLAKIELDSSFCDLPDAITTEDILELGKLVLTLVSNYFFAVVPNNIPGTCFIVTCSVDIKIRELLDKIITPVSYTKHKRPPT